MPCSSLVVDFIFTINEQYQGDKHWLNRLRSRFYLNYTRIACGCLWIDRESIWLENHCGWGEHSPKTTREETGKSGRWEKADDRGNGKACEYSEEQWWKKERKKKSSQVGTNRRSKGVRVEKVQTLADEPEKIQRFSNTRRLEKKDTMQSKRKQVGYCETMSWSGCLTDGNTCSGSHFRVI